MKAICISLCWLILVPAAFGQDFQGIAWGMPSDDVPELQGDNVRQYTDPNGLFDAIYMYQGHADGQEAAIRYYVIDGKVVQGKYSFVHSFAFGAENAYIEAYEANKQKLTQRYGSPSSDVVEWSDEEYRSRPASWGQALLKGHVAFQAEWVTPSSTTVRLSLRRSNNVGIQVMYISPGVLDGTIRQQASSSAAAAEAPTHSVKSDLETLLSYYKQKGVPTYTNVDYEFATHLAEHSVEDLRGNRRMLENVIYSGSCPEQDEKCQEAMNKGWALHRMLMVALWIKKWNADKRRGRSAEQQRLIRQHPDIGWISGYWCKEGEPVPNHKITIHESGRILYSSDSSIDRITYSYFDFDRSASGYYETWSIDANYSWGTHDIKVSVERYEKRSADEYAIVYRTSRSFSDYIYPEGLTVAEQKAHVKELVRPHITPEAYEVKQVYQRCE